MIISSPSGKYLDNRGFFQAIRTIWEISRLTRIFRGYPEIFQAIWEFSSLSRNFLDHLKNIQTIHQLSRPSGNFLDGQETSQYNFKNYPEAKKISGWQCHYAMSNRILIIRNNVEHFQVFHLGLPLSTDPVQEAARLSKPPCMFYNKS